MADGVQYAFMLAMHPLQIAQPAFGCILQGAHAGAGDDHGAQVGHQIRKMRIGGGAGHFHVESKIARNRVRVRFNRLLKGLQGSLHGVELRVCAALGREACGFGFEADAQLQHSDHICHGGQIALGNLKVTGLGAIHHKGADAVTRLHQVGRLQFGERLPHDRTAHRKPAHDFGFSGQLVAHLEFAAFHLGAQRENHLIHQPFGAARTSQRRFGRGKYGT